VQKAQTELAQGFVAFAETAITLADADRIEELAALIGARAVLNKSLVIEALVGPSTEATAAVCRIAGLPLNSYSAVLRMRVRRYRQAVDAYALLAAYRKTESMTARELLRIVRQLSAQVG
jgi:hypothetical protein